MNLWSLLLPFKWIIIGVGEVFRGIFILLKGIASLLGSLFKYLFEGIMIVSRGIFLVLKDILFKYLFLLIKVIVVKTALLFSLLFHGLKVLLLGLLNVLKTFILGLFKALKFIIVNGFKGVVIVVKSLLLALKYIGIYLYKGIYYIFKYLFLIIKYIGIYLYKVFYYIFKYIIIGFKYFFIYLYKFIFIIFKYLFIAVKTIFIYIGKTMKFIIVDVLYRFLGVFIIAILKAIVAVLKFIGSIPGYMWKGIKWVVNGIYKAIIFPFVYIHEHFGEMVRNTARGIRDRTKKILTTIINLPKNIKKSIVTKFNNISFIKDMRNRTEMKRQALMIDFDAADNARSEKKIIYHYVAKNADGKIEKGTLGAFSKLDVHSYLLAEGYEVYEIKPMRGLNLSIGPTTRRINISELVFFLTQLSTYIKAGIPLVDAIKILGKQTRKGNTKTVYKSIIYDLTMGESFSEALEKQGLSFPRLLVNMIKSSELAGNLSETLDDMAEYYTSVSRTRKQMKSAMTYPTVILVFALSVVVFILTFVIPSFIEMYKNADAEVPALTTAVINLSDFLVRNAIWLVLGVMATILGLYFMFKNVKVFRMLIQWLLMHTPIVGNIIIYNEVTMFSKTFASLWNHNVFITSSMEILSKITDNEIYKMLIFDAITNVARGESVSTSFKNHWAFPVVAYEMLITGERTGQPGPMMDKVAEYYQEEHKNAINQVKAFIEPALIILLAVVVGIILLSVILPMFNIYGQLGVGE